MEFNNYTPFEALAWENVNKNDKWFSTAIARVKLEFEEINTRGLYNLKLAKDQGELFVNDIYFDEDALYGSLKFPNDLTPFKKNTDVIINAKTFSKENKELDSWKCGIKISSKENELLKEYILDVSATQEYKKKDKNFEKKDLKKISSLELKYEKAYGGAIIIPAKDENEEDEYLVFDEYNPSGCGIQHKKDIKTSVFDAQVKYTITPDTKAPAGFGAIASFYKSRLELAGTYDKKWIENQHPLPPKDFNVQFNQVAHPELIMEGYINEGAKFEFLRMFENQELASFTLPKYDLVSRFKTKTGDIFKRMLLDTVLIDIGNDKKEDNAVYLSYRVQIPVSQKDIVTDIILLQENKETNG